MKINSTIAAAPLRQPAMRAKQEILEETSPDAVVLSSSATVSTADSHLATHLQVLSSSLVQQVGSELSGLPASGLMFHGTSAQFDSVEVRPNTRSSAKGIDWKGTAIFAAMDPRVALHYTANRRTGVGTGIDLRGFTEPDQPITFSLYGGANKEEALNRVYGDPANPESCEGYVHLLDKSKFVHEQGLGTMEMITRDPSANLGRLTIDRRAALEKMVKAGSVVINWQAED